MRRRYESWFLRLGLADGSGAWWFRYILTNPGRSGCEGTPPAQVWATWFARTGVPETYIEEFPLEALDLQPRRDRFALGIGANSIKDDACRGALNVRGQTVSWDLTYHSNFATTLSNKGWIGFSRTPHSDAIFSGEIRLGERVFHGDRLGLGVQGHNCGFRHRHFWTWMHACFPQPDGTISTFEALVYEMPFGFVFRKAVLWHQGRALFFRNLRESHRDRQSLRWDFVAKSSACSLEVNVDGSGSLHRLPYAKTDGSGTFEVSNNSRARARLAMHLQGSAESAEFTTEDGAVLEMAGDYRP